MLVRRIAVSGGPGAGKTTLWRSLAAAHPALLLPVPEVATLLLSHVFPAVQNESERGAVQRAIFAVQHNLEQVYESRASGNQVLLCDRGSPDGAGYWPAGPDHFFGSMQTAWQVEVSRYDAVVFMESAAVGGLSIAEGNVVRTEDLATAASIDAQIRAVWQTHPRFIHVPHERDFAVKVARGQALVEQLLATLYA